MPEPGERVVGVPAERVGRWVDTFGARHGGFVPETDGTTVRLTATDGAVAVIAVPFPPLSGPGPVVAGLIAHVLTDRPVGALLVRRGGWAVGLFDGPRLVRSKVGRSYVQGQTKAGGWSQQRYARRRAQQADHLYGAAADVAAELLLPVTTKLAALVGGGDAPGVEAVLADRRLAALRPLLAERVLPTPDPRLRVLEEFGHQLREVRITLNALA